MPQKDREILRARSDVRGEQASLCGAFKLPRPARLSDSTQGACAPSAGPLCPDGGGPPVHVLSLFLPDTRAGQRRGGPPRGARTRFTPKGLEQRLSSAPEQKNPYQANLLSFAALPLPHSEWCPHPNVALGQLHPLLSTCCLSHLRLQPLHHHLLWAFRLL